ncbi:MAG: hypothetical protein ABI885_11575 [Gammaproteobacteria bacterium]
MIKKFISLMLFAGVLAAGTSTASAQSADDHAYTEGPVVVVSYVRTEPGMFDEYLKYLGTTYKKLMDEYKKAGLIVGYSVFSAEPRNGTDADLILTITYKNYAALDNLAEKSDPIDRKIWGSLTKADEAAAGRTKMRTNVGGQTLRELILK